MPIPAPPRIQLKRWADGESVVPELENPAGQPLAARDLIACPQCEEWAPIDGPACPHCGFPFSCALALPDRERRQHQLEAWRVLLALGALLMLLTSGLFYNEGFDRYNGFSFSQVSTLQPAVNSGIPINGPPAFVQRTQLALGLIEQRAPQFYWRLQENAASIDYLSPEMLNSPEGRKVNMEGIGAVATPAIRRIQVLPTTAFPYGGEANDRAVYNYAATLVHELRHIELHWNHQAPGGWQEEVLCEESALSFLKSADAPGGLIAEKELYLADPLAARYQHWYKWYEQFERD